RGRAGARGGPARVCRPARGVQSRQRGQFHGHLSRRAARHAALVRGGRDHRQGHAQPEGRAQAARFPRRHPVRLAFPVAADADAAVSPGALMPIDPTRLTAIDVHVHLEAPKSANAAETAATKYFGDSGAARDGAALVDYYRSRQMACVLFTVDERLTGRPQVSNDTVVELAQANPDVIIPFASIDPTRGP